MKTCLFTLILFSLTFSLVVGNAFYICSAVDKLTAKLDTITSPNDAEEIQALHEAWKKQKPFIQISVPHDKIDTATDLLSALTVYGQNGDIIEFQKTTVLLRTALHELCALEKPTVVNIL